MSMDKEPYERRIAIRLADCVPGDSLSCEQYLADLHADERRGFDLRQWFRVGPYPNCINSLTMVDFDL